MRILQFNHWGSNIGGVEGYIADVTTALEAAGHVSRLVSFADENPDNLMKGTLSVATASPETSETRLEEIVAGFQPDAAYVHALYDPNILHWVLNRLPSLAYVHGPYLGCPGYALFLRQSVRVCNRKVGFGCLRNAQIERCCFGRSPLTHLRQIVKVQNLLAEYRIVKVPLLAGSEFMKLHLVRNGIAPGRMRVLPPVLINKGIDHFTPPIEPRSMIFAARLTPEKGLPVLLEALALIRDEWKLYVAGEGPEKPTYERQAKHLGILDRIVFQGWLEDSAIHDLYQRCGFAIVPSLWPEPYGRVGPEAYSHGRPVIGFAVGGIPDWLDHQETGYLVAPADVVQLRDRIANLLGNSDEQERMGKNALNRSHQLWDASRHVTKLLEYFQEIR